MKYWNEDFIVQSFAIIIGIIIVLVICLVMFVMIQTQRAELKMCADAYGYKFTWADGQLSVPFTAERLNDTTIVCCDSNKFITSDGVLAKGKCIYAFYGTGVEK